MIKMIKNKVFEDIEDFDLLNHKAILKEHVLLAGRVWHEVRKRSPLNDQQ